MVSGSFLAFQLRGADPFFRIYRDSILKDALAGFVNLDQRAKKVADDAFKRMLSRPGTDDFGDADREAEWASEEGQAYYEAMTGLRQATINLLAAGLFHLLEQQLAKLTYCQVCRDIHLHPDKVNIENLQRWYKDHLDLDFEQITPHWESVKQLKLVANAVKHADGRSAQELRGKREDLFRSPTLNSMNLPTPEYDNWPIRSPLSGEDLFVTKEAFSEFANVVAEFIEDVVAHFQCNAGKGYPCGQTV